MIEVALTLALTADATPAVQPWFSAPMAGVWGGAVGGGVYGGLLLGCGAGAICGSLAQAGKARRFVMIYMLCMVGIAVTLVATATTAILTKQPYHVWYPIMLMGVVGMFVCVPGMFMFRGLYAKAEQRRLEADSIRTA